MNIPQRTIDRNTEALKKQSRSFAIPILELDENLRYPIMVEYNLNKTLDTIEDSKILTTEDKIALIDKFCDALSKNNVSAEVRQYMLEITPENESFVFKNYGDTINLFNSLSKEEQKIGIVQTKKMAEGMKIFLKSPINSMKDLNEYCYYVAGTVGEYLISILEVQKYITKDEYHKLQPLALGFGRFLQKLNILRDFKEDQSKNLGAFWPVDLLKDHSEIETLNILCEETLRNDAKAAIDFFKIMPDINSSFSNFIKFILHSGLEYISILKNNPKIFNISKVKLPRIIIQSLYKNVSKISKDKFVEKSEFIRIAELQAVQDILTRVS